MADKNRFMSGMVGDIGTHHSSGTSDKKLTRNKGVRIVSVLVVLSMIISGMAILLSSSNDQSDQIDQD